MAEFFSSQSEVKHLSNFSRKVSLTIFLSEVNSKQKFYFERTCLGQFGFILRCVMGMHLPWWVFWGCLLCRLCPEDQHTELYRVVPVSAQPGRWYLSKNEQKIRILLNRCQFLLKCFSIGVEKLKPQWQQRSIRTKNQRKGNSKNSKRIHMTGEKSDKTQAIKPK